MENNHDSVHINNGLATFCRSMISRDDKTIAIILLYSLNF